MQVIKRVKMNAILDKLGERYQVFRMEMLLKNLLDNSSSLENIIKMKPMSLILYLKCVQLKGKN